MRRNSWLDLAAALFAALAASCSDGGQTGQPTAGSCRPVVVAADDVWRGTTVGELAQAFNGSHQAELHWLEQRLGSAVATPVTFDDSVTIAVEYLGESATSSSCGGDLEIPVAVEVATSESTLAEHGIGSLRLSGTTSPLIAQLTFVGNVVSVNAALTETALAEVPRGTLEPQGADAPGGSAIYP